MVSLLAARGIQFPDQGLNPGPLHWEHRGIDHPRSEVELGRPAGTVPVYILGIEGRERCPCSLTGLQRTCTSSGGRRMEGWRDELSFHMGFAHTHVYFTQKENTTCLKSFTPAIISTGLFLALRPPIPAPCGRRDLSSPSRDSGVLTAGPPWEALRDDFWIGIARGFFLLLCCILPFLW